MADDFLHLRGYDHVEFYVGNAKQAAHFYDKSFGFKPVAKLGLETGCRDRASYVMQQGQVRFVLTSALTPDSEIARHCALHGDGVKVVALETLDCESAMQRGPRRGGTIVSRRRRSRMRTAPIKTGIIKLRRRHVDQARRAQGLPRRVLPRATSRSRRRARPRPGWPRSTTSSPTSTSAR
jgi:4-hydroxyphenylpyruvate dioxygenase-like putative hemolysin